MRRIRVALATGIALVGVVVPGTSRADAPGELTVRSEQVDYEVGQRLDWTVDWKDLQPANGIHNDVIASLEGPHELVADSIDVPRGWSITYSEDGRTFVGEPTDKVTHVKFTDADRRVFPAAVASVALPGDILVQTAIPQPLPTIATASNGGDGYIPMLAGDRIYAVWHHMAASATQGPNIVCVDTLTGATCPNYPKLLGWQTSFNQGQGIFVNNRIYIKNRDATTHGVYCWDTDTEKSCGYFPVATLGPVTGTNGGNGGWDQFTSPVLHKGRMYFAGHNFRVYCFDPETESVCADYGLAGRATSRFGEAHVSTRRLNDVVYNNGRLIFSLATSWADSPVPLGAKDTCFDLDAGAPCLNWGNGGTVTETAGTAYIFTRYDASGTPIGYCHGVQSGAGEAPLQASVPCYDFNGKNRTTIQSVQPFGQFRPYNVEEDTIGTRTFFGRYSTLGAYCYDWATSAPCKGSFFDANGRSTKSLAEHFYGFVKRGDCMVGLGHKGIMMSIDPLTGGTPCRQIYDSSFVASASSRYCRDTTHLDGWRLATVSGVSASDFSLLEATFTDGTTSITADLRSGAVSLTGLDRAKGVRVNLRAIANPSANPWATGQPNINMLYGGSTQFCFQSVVRAKTEPVSVDAQVDGVKESAELTVDPTPADVGEPSEATIPVQQARPSPTLPATGSSRVLGLTLALFACGTGLVVIGRRRIARLQ